MKMNKKIFVGFVVVVVLFGHTIIGCASSGSGNKSSVSDKPVNWREIRDITYGDGKFVVVGNKIAYSSDGINWIDVEGKDFNCYCITYGGGMFVAGGGGGRIWYSSDGINWTAHPKNTYRKSEGGYNIVGLFNSGSESIEAIAYGNGRFVAISSHNKIAFSTDGINWQYREQNFHFSTGIAYGGGRFVTVGSYVHGLDDVFRGIYACSTDGINWTSYRSQIFVSEVKNEAGGQKVDGIVYGNNKFIAWGNGGIRQFSRSKYDTKIMYSNDGINWIQVSNTTFGSEMIFDIAYGNGRFVAVGANGKIAYSTDGINWIALLDEAFGFSNILTITYGDDKFVAGSGSSRIAYSSTLRIAYSSNGINWTPVSFGESN